MVPMIGPGANHGEPKDGSGWRRPPVRFARMEPRYRLAVCRLAWHVAAGPAFPEDLDRELSCRNIWGYVAVSDPPRQTASDAGPLVGYMQLLLARRFAVVQHLAVQPRWQRHGIGGRLLSIGVSLLTSERVRLLVDVPQSSRYLAAHLFLARQGLVAQLHPDASRRDDWLRFELVVPTLF